jgi:hypothetical protein
MSERVSYQVLIAIDTGVILSTLLPAFKASHSEGDQAVATAGWTFIRSFVCIWVVTIPAATFNNRLQIWLDRISDMNVRTELVDGRLMGVRRASSFLTLKIQRAYRSSKVLLNHWKISGGYLWFSLA